MTDISPTLFQTYFISVNINCNHTPSLKHFTYLYNGVLGACWNI